MKFNNIKNIIFGASLITFFFSLQLVIGDTHTRVRDKTAIIFPDTQVQLDLKKFENIAVEKCQQYTALKFPKDVLLSTSHLGNSTTIIAEPLEFPHMVALGYGTTTEDPDNFKCGGSLISETWILTAAHCYKDADGSLASWARLGDLDIGSKLDFAQPEDHQIIQHIIHPDYKPLTEKYNDIALFRLESDIKFSAFVRPICLNSDPLSYPIQLIATGWGAPATGEMRSETMLKVTLNDVPNNQCNIYFSTGSDKTLNHGIMGDSMICAAEINDGEGACEGFAGGPLLTRNGDQFNSDTSYTQFGITSFGLTFCGSKDTPGVYTRVSKYIEWIEEIVWSDS